ncbi:MAG: FAD-dependent oxidoreductase [Janthinobacterium lividum]
MIPSATSPHAGQPQISPAPFPSVPDLPRSADVVVVGAGVAGLACAKHLAAAGVNVLVIDKADGVGGRVRSDVVGDFRVDRGFQLFNPAYPEVAKVIDVQALHLQAFDAGVAVHRHGRVSAIRDPRRHPAALLAALRFPLGSAKEKVALLKWVRSTLSAADLKGEDTGWSDALDAAEVHGDLRWSVLEPFLAGVLGEVDGTTSRRYVDLIVRSFLRGTPGVPAAGMQAVPDQLAASLPLGTVHTGVEALHVGHGPRTLMAETTFGAIGAGAIVMASDAGTTAHLVGMPIPDMHALSTFWYAAGSSPATGARGKLLHLDGDRNGPIVNTAVMSAVAPSYVLTPGDRRALVSAQVLGADTSAEVESRVRAQLSRIYGGVNSRTWTLVAAQSIPQALPALPPPFEGPRPVAVGDGIFVAGDHRENPSLQGALVSGRRAAAAAAAWIGLGRRHVGAR